MFKPLTLSLSLAVALGACSVSMAGLFASSQCPSPQGGACASGQSCLPSAQCLPKKHWNFHCPKPCFTYQWVLRRKLCWSCGNPSCTTCVAPSSQCGPSSQILGSGQAYPTTYGYGGIYGAGQMTTATPGAAAPMTPATTGDEAPPAPEVAPAAPTAPAPPAPEAPAAPAAPAPPAPAPGATSSLLFSTPTGN
jgi:hypothetical protein